MKDWEIKKLSEKYIKQKGIEYAKKSRLNAKNAKFSNNRIYSEDKIIKINRSRPIKDKNYVHEIFREIVEVRAMAKSKIK
jgi:hypothetical protein